MKHNDFYIKTNQTSHRLEPSKILPQLSFRYSVEFLNQPEFENIYFSSVYVKLPTLQKGSSGGENLWSAHPMTIKFYKFELPNAIENQLIDLCHNSKQLDLKVNFVEPDGKTVNGYWEITGDIDKCDFGEVSWEKDDVVLIELSIIPREFNKKK